MHSLDSALSSSSLEEEEDNEQRRETNVPWMILLMLPLNANLRQLMEEIKGILWVLYLD